MFWRKVGPKFGMLSSQEFAAGMHDSKLQNL